MESQAIVVVFMHEGCSLSVLTQSIGYMYHKPSYSLTGLYDCLGLGLPSSY